ncbi:hypothetical protein H0H92_006007 [Tricholoma furcatifolium]|nr:hypothetical protein H0H92_006007 [Tricholoma furcatifolium]
MQIITDAQSPHKRQIVCSSPLLSYGQSLSIWWQTFVQSHIASEQWPRFYYYSKRIRHLKVTDDPVQVHRDAFTRLALGRQVFHLLPNLTHLTWDMDTFNMPTASLGLSLLLLMPKLEGLSLLPTVRVMTEAGLTHFEEFFNEVIHRSPGIETFQFTADVDLLGPALSRFLTRLLNLRSVKLAEALLTSDTISALSRSQYLQSIHIEVHRDIDVGNIHRRSFLPLIKPGSFPCLEEIELKAGLSDIMSFLKRPNFPATCLRRLFVQTQVLENTSTIGAFFAVVADHCPTIQEFILCVAYRLEQHPSCLPFTAVEPLLRCKSVTHFSLDMCVPVEIDNAIASRVATAWPRLQEFRLIASPVVVKPREKYLTFEVMSIFAHHCPLLRELSIYIQPLDIPPPSTCNPLPNLKILSLGLMSASYTPDEFASFLGEITSAKCNVGAQMIDFSMSGDGPPVSKETNMKLQQTLSRIPAFRNVHAHYQARLKDLEAQSYRRCELNLVSATS